MRRLTFAVAGIPVTQGSKDGYVRPGKDGKPHARMVERHAGPLMAWREAVRSTALEYVGECFVPLCEPVIVELRFALPKPASAPKRRRTWPIGRRSGDIDKLSRAVLDAITQAGIWLDDSQVISLHAVKDYPYGVDRLIPGVTISIEEATPELSTEITAMAHQEASIRSAARIVSAMLTHAPNDEERARVWESFCQVRDTKEPAMTERIVLLHFYRGMVLGLWPWPSGPPTRPNERTENDE